MESLANERAWCFALGQSGGWESSQTFFERSVDLYTNNWGAKNKAGSLITQEKSEQQIIRRVKKDVRDDPDGGLHIG